MADELKISALLKFAKGLRSFDSAGLGFTGLVLDVAGTDFVYKTQTVTTSAAALNLGSITSAGYFIGKNLEAEGGTNYIEIRDGSTGADVPKIRPGGIALFELATSTPYVIANGESAELLYAVIEL